MPGGRRGHVSAGLASVLLLLFVGEAAAGTLKPGGQNAEPPKTPPPTTSLRPDKKAKFDSLEVLYGTFQPSLITQNVLDLNCNTAGLVDPPTYHNFVITYKAVGKTSAKTDPVCQIDTALVGTDYQPFDNAPFLRYLATAIDRTLGKVSRGQAGVRICGLMETQDNIKCPPIKAKDWAKGAQLNARAAAHGDPLPWPGVFERANYRRVFEVIATVKGFHVDSFVDTTLLAKIIQQETAARLKSAFGSRFNCEYKVNVQITPYSAPADVRSLVYRTKLVDATLFPDGYAFLGTFYTDAAGRPQMLGPTVESYENDQIVFEVTNEGMMGQATHFHGMLFKDGYQYNDGPVGTTQGPLVTGKSYNYTFVSYPAGTSYYHGHHMQAHASGNRGLNVVKKRPCNDPYAGYYDEEINLVLDASNPWFLDLSTTPVTALRHTTGEEDWNNFNGTTCNFCYPNNGNAANVQTITLDYGGEPLSDQPWSGPLINGKSRAIPQNYSSEPNSGVSQSWGAPAGSYFSVNVQKGKTYRLRIMNTAIMWGFRFWIEDHDITIISIDGGDVQPILIPAKKPGVPFNGNGIELSTAERYDVLITANQENHKDFVIRVDSLDGCYKGVGFLLYDGQTMTPTIEARGDAIQRDRRCDADCYGPDGCNIYKQFASDRNLAQIKSIEPQGIPPPNPLNKRMDFVIVENGGFMINNQRTPTFNPPLYLQHMNANNSLAAMQDPTFLAQYSFAPNEVIDWCIVTFSADRHPMHLHADRFWALGSGFGNVTDCWASPVAEGKPTLWADVFNTLVPLDTPTSFTPAWIKIRTKITNIGAWMLHCHLSYHMDLNLMVPLLIGVEQPWPMPPMNLPNGPYQFY